MVQCNLPIAERQGTYFFRCMQVPFDTCTWSSSTETHYYGSFLIKTGFRSIQVPFWDKFHCITMWTVFTRVWIDSRGRSFRLPEWMSAVLIHSSLDRLQRQILPVTGVTVSCLNKSYAPWNYYFTASLNILCVKAVVGKNVIVCDKYANCTYAMFVDASKCHWWNAGECTYSQNAWYFTGLTVGLKFPFHTAWCTRNS